MAEKLRALVIDDEMAIRRLFEVALQSTGWTVVTAESAEEALEYIANETFDALIVDKNLPRMTGVEVIRELRKTNDTSACVMITAHSSLESAMTTMQLGIDAYIEKPFDNVYALVEHIRELVDKRRARVASVHPSADTRQLSVLLACAEGADRDRLQTWFETKGDRVEVVGTLGRLESHLGEANPDVLVVDEALDAPGLAELLAHIRQRVRMPVTFVLASVAPTLRVVIDLIASEVRGVIERPVAEGALDDRIGDTVAKLRQIETGVRE